VDCNLSRAYPHVEGGQGIPDATSSATVHKSSKVLPGLRKFAIIAGFPDLRSG
jgi:hypothetical protein